MTVIKWKEIVSNATKYKKYVEEHHELPKAEKYSYAQWLDIFCKAVLNPGKDVTVRKVKACPNCSGDEINKNLTRNEYEKLCTNIIKWINNDGTAPNYVNYQNIHISIKLCLYVFADIIDYYNTNHKLLTGHWFRSSIFNKQKPAPVAKKYGHATSSGCDNRGQNNGVYCGPHSMQECIRNLTGKVISQSQLASWAGTTSGGTDHYGIETAIAMAAKKLGVKLSCKWYNFSDLGWSGIKKILESNNQDCIIHNLYRDQWGHYEVINKVYSDYCDVQNSLGESCSNGCYCGYVEERYLSTFVRYMSGISQKSVLVVTRG